MQKIIVHRVHHFLKLSVQLTWFWWWQCLHIAVASLSLYLKVLFVKTDNPKCSNWRTKYCLLVLPMQTLLQVLHGNLYSSIELRHLGIWSLNRIAFGILTDDLETTFNLMSLLQVRDTGTKLILCCVQIRRMFKFKYEKCSIFKYEKRAALLSNTKYVHVSNTENVCRSYKYITTKNPFMI